MKFGIKEIVLCLVILTLYILPSQGQQYRVLSSNYHKDSSIYAVAQVSQNAFWMGGENAYIKEVNEKGEVSDLDISLEGMDVLKITADDSSIYIVGTGPRIFIVNKSTKAVKKYSFESKLRKRCFYDILLLPNNKMMLCGGDSRIAEATKVLPIGFIAICDRSNPDSTFEIIKNNRLKFMFTMEYNPATNEVYASTFNGINSIIYKSSNSGIQWTKVCKVSGIIHDLQFDDDGKLWFAGSQGMKYRKNGMFGYIQNNQIVKRTSSSGCLWRLCQIEDDFYAPSVSGSLLKISKKTLEFTTEKTSMNGALYTLANFSNKALIICGHGKSVCIRN